MVILGFVLGGFFGTSFWAQFICIGLNYSDHAAETGQAVPEKPIVFFKATSAICGPDDTVMIPRGSEQTDWEVELAVIIGKRARYVPEEEAMEHVAGYALHNDYSEREHQLAGPEPPEPPELRDLDEPGGGMAGARSSGWKGVR